MIQKLKITYTGLILSILFAFGLVACDAGFETNLNSHVEDLGSSPSISLKLEARGSGFVITSGFDATSAIGKNFTWLMSTNLQAGQDYAKYQDVAETNGPELLTDKLPLNFSGLVMLLVSLGDSNHTAYVFSYPLPVTLYGGLPIVGTPTPTVTPTPRPTMIPKPTATLTPIPTVTQGPSPTPPPLASTTAPSWVGTLTPGSWTAIGAKNTLDSVDPEKDPNLNPNYPSRAPWHQNSGQSCMINCWNGGAFASNYSSHGVYMVFGGGHAGYSGNEIYAFDMGTRTWGRLNNPYLGTSSPNSLGAFPDGSPAPPHTGDTVEYHPGMKAFFTFRAVSDNRLSSLTANVKIPYLFDFTQKKWFQGASYANTNANLYSSSSAYDPNRQEFWMLSNAIYGKGILEYDPRTKNSDGTYGKIAVYGTSGGSTYGNAEIDPDYDVYAYISFGDSDPAKRRIRGIDLKNPAAASFTITESGSIPPNKEAKGGWTWSNKRKAFLYWGENSPYVYAFKLTSATSGVWTRLNVDAKNPAAMTVTDNGLYRTHSRFRVASYQGEDVAIIINGTLQDVYAFRIP